MISQLKRLIALPALEDEKENGTAGLLSTILWSALVIIGVSNIIIFLMLENPYQSLVAQSSLILIIIITLRLMYHGYRRLAATAFISATWLIILGTALKYDGVNGFAFTAYILVILMAGLLLGEKTGIFFATLSLVTGFLLMIGEFNGWVPLRHSRNPFTIAWVVNSIYFIFTVVLLSLYTSNLNRALNTARRNAEHLAERNRDLQAAHHLLSVRAGELLQTNSQLAQEITERRRAEHQIQIALKEKETLLQEIHHRVKNNLQIVASLLSLQSQYLADPAALEALAESQTRVRSMAMIHEQLYHSDNLAKIDFGEYIQTLGRQLLRSYRGNIGFIDLKVTVKDVSLEIDRAIPCGLLMTELITNAIKHGFPNHQNGQISIDFHHQDGGSFVLAVKDDGVGFPAELIGCLTKNGLSGPCVQSLGLQLIDSLTNQLEGTVHFTSRPGATTFNITFPAVDNYQPAAEVNPSQLQT